jgi:catalase
MSDDLATHAVDAINRNYGGNHTHRAAHAKGFCVEGTFTGSAAAAGLTRAAHFRGAAIPVTVRFSNGSGILSSADYHVDGRGLAIKFHLPDGSATDIVCLTQRTFFVRTPEEFLELTAARDPDPNTGRPDPVRIGDFLTSHPEAQPAFADVLFAEPVAGYARCEYYGIHAFLWTGADGASRYVRYHWLPEDGVATLTREDAKARGRDFLRAELEERLARGPAAFKLELQIAEEDDDVSDPTREWPAERRRVDAGRLELTQVANDQDAGCEQLVFDPTRLTDGIEASPDPILHFRPLAYDVSVRRRLKLG